jgi:Tol biopolymer transport system component
VLLGLVVVGFVAAGVLAFLLTRTSGSDPVAGDRIAYGCRESRNPWYAICVSSADGSDPTRVTRDLPTTDPSWSPDGRRLAFTRNEDVGESTTFTFDDVFVMDADGSDLRQVTADEEDLWSGQPTWSPDGTELAYVRGESVASTVSSKYGELYRIELDGEAMRPLTAGWPDTDPDWSPDGRAIAFVRGESLSSFTDANDDLYVLELATGQVRRLTTTPAGTFENAPAWSPDGSRIAFVRTPRGSQFSGRASLHVIDRDGSREQRLLRYELFADAPYSLAWSPDGRSLAFETSSAIGCTSISVLDVETRSRRALTSCARPREATVAPTWQPVPERVD